MVLSGQLYFTLLYNLHLGPLDLACCLTEKHSEVFFFYLEISNSIKCYTYEFFGQMPQSLLHIIAAFRNVPSDNILIDSQLVIMLRITNIMST